METFIQVQNIHKPYSSQKILNGITLEINSETFYVLLEKNRAGKSTLMRILMRHEAPGIGDGTAFGLPFSGNDQGMNAKIGFVSESIEYQVNQSFGDFSMKYANCLFRNGGSVVMATNIVSEVKNHGARFFLIENKSIQVDLPISEMKSLPISKSRIFSVRSAIFTLAARPCSLSKYRP